MQLWIVEHFFHHKKVPVLQSGTFLWWKKCSTIQSCIFPKSDFLQNSYFNKYPKCPKIYLPKLSAQAQKFWILMKKGFIGRP